MFRLKRLDQAVNEAVRCTELKPDNFDAFELLGRIFSNLIGNATKYAPDQTTVTIDGWQTADGGATVCVRDEGPGIPESEVGRIFERFYRASTSTGIAGSGIGLHLAQYFVELHDGTIDVETEVGKGSAFHVHLPPGNPTQDSSP